MTRRPARSKHVESYVGEHVDVPEGARMGGASWRYEVVEDDGRHVRVAQMYPDKDTGAWKRGNTWLVVRESWEHMKADLACRAPEPTRVAAERTGGSGSRVVDEVLAGRAECLGKGDDAVAWRVGDVVVKASTPVPFHPMNYGGRTPEAAARAMIENIALAEQLAVAGVPGILVPKLVVVGAGPAIKAFSITPLLTVLKGKNSREQSGAPWTKATLDQAAQTMSRLLELGIGLFDDLQAGVDREGRVWLFDIGKARPLRPAKGMWSDLEDAIRSLEQTYKAEDIDFDPPPGPILEYFWTRLEKMSKSKLWIKIEGRTVLRDLERHETAFRRAGYPVDTVGARIATALADPRDINDLPDED